MPSVKYYKKVEETKEKNSKYWADDISRMNIKSNVDKIKTLVE